MRFILLRGRADQPRHVLRPVYCAADLSLKNPCPYATLISLVMQRISLSGRSRDEKYRPNIHL